MLRYAVGRRLTTNNRTHHHVYNRFISNTLHHCPIHRSAHTSRPCQQLSQRQSHINQDSHIQSTSITDLPSQPPYITLTDDNLYIDRRLPSTYHTILIANRGEIACRIIRTCRQLGIRTVTVHSDIDANSQHVLMSDVSYNIGGNPARDSYLRSDVILSVARISGAQAVHPGYGFMSENAKFAEACADAGIDFIGPPSSAIVSMGSKSESKNIMLAANVPCIPGYHGDDQSIDGLRQHAEQVGFPLMIKAVSGGGGKGMRIVRSMNEFDESLESCKRESLNSFSDDRVLIERYIQRPRHIEFQIFADKHGNAVHLYERDCSVQRRHQKVLVNVSVLGWITEEAPAPGMSDELRHRMGQAAINAALAVGYVGAGTVEFIFDADAADQAIGNGGVPDNCYYFMEMNTRLQVEHPVTEMIVRRDLVQLQLHVSAGYSLPFTQSDILASRPYGHAIEARIYAENPRNNFLPATGKLYHIHTPQTTPYVRVESGVVSGDQVSIFYDPMIAKLIVWGADRQQALNRMHTALAEYQVVGPPTNIEFVLHCIANEQFRRGQVDTGFIAQNVDQLLPPQSASQSGFLLAAMYLLLSHEAQHQADNNPWNTSGSFRVNCRYRSQLTIALQQIVHEADSSQFRQQMKITHIGGRIYKVHTSNETYSVVQASLLDNKSASTNIVVTVNNEQHHAQVVIANSHVHVFDTSDGSHDVFALPVHSYIKSEAAAGGPIAAMSGKVVKVNVKANDKVVRGQPLVIMEAMKMEHVIKSQFDGIVSKVYFQNGDFVEGGKLLCQVDPVTL